MTQRIDTKIPSEKSLERHISWRQDRNRETATVYLFTRAFRLKFAIHVRDSSYFCRYPLANIPRRKPPTNFDLFQLPEVIQRSVYFPFEHAHSPEFPLATYRISNVSQSLFFSMSGKQLATIKLVGFGSYIFSSRYHIILNKIKLFKAFCYFIHVYFYYQFTWNH